MYIYYLARGKRGAGKSFQPVTKGYITHPYFGDDKIRKWKLRLSKLLVEVPKLLENL